MRLSWPSGIGPHEGRELELLLAGRKPIALFFEIDPYAAFEPHVRDGRFVRKVRSYVLNGRVLKAAFYFPPANEARFRELDLIYRLCARGNLHFSDALEFRVGRLLGYSERDIMAFLKWGRRLARLRKSLLNWTGVII